MAKTTNLKKKSPKRNVKNRKSFKYSPIKEKKSVKKSEHGWVYIGHIPHGFYEEAISSYFKQFGKVINVRVCRSRRTGKSKGYGFIEFENVEVAKIAANAMDNYLFFKKRLVAKFVAANKMQKLRIDKTVPWSEQNYPLKQIRHDVNWQRNADPDRPTYIENCKKLMMPVRRTLKKLKELGIDYSFQPVDVPVELQQKFKIETESK